MEFYCLVLAQWVMASLIFNKQPIIYMHTPSSASTHTHNHTHNQNHNHNHNQNPNQTHNHSRRLPHMHSILQQLDRKIIEISELKGMMVEAICTAEVQQSSTKGKKLCGREMAVFGAICAIGKEIREVMGGGIRRTLSEFNNLSMQNMVTLINYYQQQLKKCKGYYQSQIWDLREQIKRQYKVIAMMKQEVEDLMILMKYKEGGDGQEPENEESMVQQDHQNARTGYRLRLDVGARQYAGDLEVIDEETERTLQSSERSQGNGGQMEKGSNFIKIQEKQEENQCLISRNKSQDLQQWKNGLSMQNKQEQLHQNKSNTDYDYSQFNENLTPKQADKLTIKNVEGQESKLKQNEVLFNKEAVFPEPSAIEQPIQQKRKNKIHTAPSDDRKVDHLQSIFFLDDEPEEFLNKTAKLKSFGQKMQLFDQHHDQNHSLKSLRRSQLSAEQEYSPVQDINYHQKNPSMQPVGQFFRQCSSQASSVKNSFQSSGRSDVVQRYALQQKRPKTNRIMTQEETNQYVNRKFNKIKAVDEFQSSASVPVASSQGPLEQLSPNISNEYNGERKSIQGKPKTKQFLEQFRKTFNKCLKSMQVSKKNSTKLTNNNTSQCKQNGGKTTAFPIYQSQPSQLGVMTFGKSNSNSSYSSIQRQKQQENGHKQMQGRYEDDHASTGSKSTIKAVDHMLKELENSNKFIIGNKKLQLKYEGEKKNGVRSGNGILYYSNGLCYEGQFRDGYRHGYGILKFNHIQIYNGDWAHDEIEGQGKIRNCAIINKRKTVYSGQTPLGKWISYSGEFKGSKFEGPGTLYLQGGEKFVGHFQNGYACGEGFIYRKNGEVQHGQWKNNLNMGEKCDKQMAI